MKTFLKILLGVLLAITAAALGYAVYTAATAEGKAVKMVDATVAADFKGAAAEELFAALPTKPAIYTPEIVGAQTMLADSVNLEANKVKVIADAEAVITADQENKKEAERLDEAGIKMRAIALVDSAMTNISSKEAIYLFGVLPTIPAKMLRAEELGAKDILTLDPDPMILDENKKKVVSMMVDYSMQDAISLNIYWAYILLGMVLVCALFSAVYTMLKSSKSPVKTIISAFAVIAVVAGAYMISKGNTVEIINVEDGKAFEPMPTLLSQTSIYIAYVAMAGAILAAIVSEIRNAFK